jgi:hypothetical protein
MNNPMDRLTNALIKHNKDKILKLQPKKQVNNSETGRGELLKLIRKYWKQYPELRLGQLLVNLAGENDIFYISNTELYKRVKQQIIKNKEDGE